MSNTEIGKDRVKIPLNTYDIFGYIIPGALALIAIYLFEFWIFQLKGPNSTLHIPVYTALNNIGIEIFKSSNWILSATFLIILLIISYAIGHIVSSISSFLVDRCLILKGYGYPYQQLLKVKRPERYWESENYYRGMFFWINALLLFLFVSLFNEAPFLQITETIIVTIIIVISFFKIILSHLRFHKSHSAYVRKILPNKIVKASVKTNKFIFACFSGIYNLIARSLSQFTNTRQAFPEEFIKEWKSKFKELFSLDPDTIETENYWFTVCYVTDHCPSLNGMIVNWLHLYSYARNLSTSFYLSFLYCFISLSLQNGLTKISQPFVLIVLPLLFFTISLIMLIRYYYLYYSYYSRFLFRAFYYLNKKPSKRNYR